MSDQPKKITCDACGRLIERAYLPRDGRILCLKCTGLVASENDVSEKSSSFDDDGG